MLTPGIWTKQELVFRDIEICHQVEHALMRSYPIYKWDRYKTIYKTGGMPNLFFIGCS